MTFTPKQAAAFIELGGKRKALEAAAHLSLTALATQGDKKDINSRIRDLSR